MRSARPWDRLSHIVAALPAGIASAAEGLELLPGDRVLDFGCADMPYRHLVPQAAEYVPADLPGNPDAVVQISADGRVELDDASFDAVLSTQVLEHVTDPGVYLAECSRVLRPGGRLLLSTHGFMVYHPDPDDYWRWTCAGLRRAVTDAGFTVESFEGIMGPGASGLQLFQDSLYWRFPRYARQLFALLMQALIAVVDRAEGPEARRMNALVFVLVARRT